LHERELIEVTGRAEGLGRPLLYGTTPLFLEQFALRHLEELPRSDELAIALRDPRQQESSMAAETPAE
jgi:segregation and condensation protein B